MANTPKMIPHIPLKFDEVVSDFLKVETTQKGEAEEKSGQEEIEEPPSVSSNNQPLFGSGFVKGIIFTASRFF
jgi:hypothetical protein